MGLGLNNGITLPDNPPTIAAELYSEADVQAKVVVPSLAEAGFRDAVGDVKISYGVPIKAQQGREVRTIFADMVVQIEDSPVIVVDSKSPRQQLTDSDREQVISYARLIGNIAPYAALCNGSAWRIYDSITKQEIGKLPTYSEIKRRMLPQPIAVRQRESLVGQATRTLFAIGSTKELSRLMRRCHDVIRNLKGYDPTKAFDELSKILFAKMYEEREIQEGRRKVNRFTTEEVVRGRQRGVEIIQTLWHDTVRSDRYKEVFADQDAGGDISLPPIGIDKIVALLENKSLGETDLDVKGVAFEEFLSATYRGGGLGQYFTPREIVNFMVELSSPQIGESVIDPACGSGGFLIRVYDVVREKILTSELSPAQARAQLKELAQRSLVGIDWEPRAARTCKMNMIIHGDGHAGVYQGNSLDTEEIEKKVKERQRICPEAPSIEEGTFDIAITNPPFGAKDTQKEILRHYELGGSGQKREVLMVERCIRLLRPGGRLVIVLPEGILSNKLDAKVREEIRKHCIIKAVIRLSQDAFKMSEGAACTSILFAVKKDAAASTVSRQGDIFFARAEYIGTSPSGSPIDKNDLPVIRDHFRRFERGEWDGIEMRSVQNDRVVFVRGMPSQGGDWLEPEVNRTSLLYDRLSYVLRGPKIEDRFSYVYDHPNYYRVMAALDQMPCEVVRLDSLCSEGFPVRGRKPSEESAEGIPILKVRNITNDGISLDTEFAPDEEEVRSECIMLEKDDLLITSTGEGTIGRVATYHFEEPAVTDGHIAICRFQGGVNVQYVEEFLKSEYGQIQMLRYVSGSTGQTELLIDCVKGLRVPIPDPEIQKKIVDDMREAHLKSREFAAGAKHLRERAAATLAAARTRMIGRIGNQDLPLDHPELLPVGSVEEQFRSYAELWKRQTLHLSSAARITSHPAYREIVKMGMPVVPLILKELSQKPDHWFVALHEITGADPVPKESQGRLTEMAGAWLSWGKAHGYTH
jgi:type I restriction enzyme M protein